jgi:hypothetical protein
MTASKRAPIRCAVAVVVVVSGLTVGFELISAGLQNPCGGGICFEHDPDNQLRQLQFGLGAILVMSGIVVGSVVSGRASSGGLLFALIGGPVAGGYANVIVGAPAWSRSWPCFVAMAVVVTGATRPPHLLSWVAGLVSGSGIAFALDDRVPLTWVAAIPLVVAALAQRPEVPDSESDDSG